MSLLWQLCNNLSNTIVTVSIFLLFASKLQITIIYYRNTDLQEQLWDISINSVKAWLSPGIVEKYCSNIVTQACLEDATAQAKSNVEEESTAWEVVTAQEEATVQEEVTVQDESNAQEESTAQSKDSTVQEELNIQKESNAQEESTNK